MKTKVKFICVEYCQAENSPISTTLFKTLKTTPLLEYSTPHPHWIQLKWQSLMDVSQPTLVRLKVHMKSTPIWNWLQPFLSMLVKVKVKLVIRKIGRINYVCISFINQGAIWKAHRTYTNVGDVHFIGGSFIRTPLWGRQSFFF